MRYDDPEGFASIRRRQKLHELAVMCTLLPRERMTWSVVTSRRTSGGTDDDIETSFDHGEYSGRYNPHVTGLFFKLQEQVDEEARANPNDVCARRSALFVSLALQAGGKGMMMCYADEAKSLQLVHAIRESFDRVRSGRLPVRSELQNLLVELAPLGCRELAA